MTETIVGATTQAIGSGATELIYLDGIEIGDMIADEYGAVATFRNTRRYGSYNFATREDAIAAAVSYATRSYWTGEK